MTKPELYAKIQDIIKVAGFNNPAGIAAEVTELIETPLDEFKTIHLLLVALRVDELQRIAADHKREAKIASEDIRVLERMALQ